MNHPALKESYELSRPVTPPVTTVPSTVEPTSAAPRVRLPEIRPTSLSEIRFDADYGTLWVWLRSRAPLKFTPELLSDLRSIQHRVVDRLALQSGDFEGTPLRYQVFASRVRGVFSLGGDLALFRELIAEQDHESMRRYAREAIDLVHDNATGYGRRLTTVSLVQGQALGGGFEAALAADVVVAEKHCKLGLPEILFNMFPGMGAFQLLTRRLSPAQAERMILSGRTYAAEELHEMGLVDVLAESGDGERAVRSFIRTHARQRHARCAFHRALDVAQPLDKGELYSMADVWVETAMGLEQRDLETIDYLLRAQQRLSDRRSEARRTAVSP